MWAVISLNIIDRWVKVACGFSEEAFILIAHENNIDVIIPWNEALVAYCAKQCAIFSKIGNIIFIADIDDDLQ